MHKDELHLHLYGCLTAEDLWTLGKKRWKHQKARLEWYAETFEKAYGRKPRWEDYWTSADGQALLQKDFLFKTPANFAKFQASFNLIIALFPIAASDTEISEHILARHKAEGFRYCEYRTIYPFNLSDADVDLYFKSLTQTFAKYSNASFTPRLAISVARDNEPLSRQYAFLKQWLRTNPDLAAYIVGLDFCFDEEGHPPKHKKEFFTKVRQDNLSEPDIALAILYHVGESFTKLSLPSAARWVWQAHALGAHRLGHAIALGVDPTYYLNQTMHESAEERCDHLHFLLENDKLLAGFGYQVKHDQINDELRKLEVEGKTGILSLPFHQGMVDDTFALQKALMASLSQESAIIESCPTSNIRIANLKQYDRHPLRRFLAHNLKVVVSSDDPGIFDITYEDELELCQKLGVKRDLVLPSLQDRSAALARQAAPIHCV